MRRKEIKKKKVLARKEKTITHNRAIHFLIKTSIKLKNPLAKGLKRLLSASTLPKGFKNAHRFAVSTLLTREV